MFKKLILLLLLLPATLFAQNTISGKVTSLVNKNAIPDASVFLSNASVGNKTGTDGTFMLNNVKNGQYDLVVSCVGYEPYHRTIMINSANINLADIEMLPKVTLLNEVKVKYDPDRDRHIKMFLQEFFGHSANADECKLLNPELLDINFEKNTGKLTAESSDFLVIENHALGYRLKYLLKSFLKDPRSGLLFYSGSSTFEPLTGNGSEQKRWVKNRIAAYRGSDMHFLRACIADQVPEEGFAVRRLIRTPDPEKPADSLINAKILYFKNSAGYNRNLGDSLRYWSDKSRLPAYTQVLIAKPVDSKDYINLTQQKGMFAFGYKDCLQINYKKSDHTTVITFNKPFSFFDSNGVILNPDSNMLEGYWGSLRIAELLPVDYELPTTF